MKKTKIYATWCNIKTRCNNKNINFYARYGGRGIKMCEEWENSFMAFYSDVSRLPNFGNPDYTLDRIDNNGNYEPGNVRWASNHTQAVNSRNVQRDNKWVGVYLQPSTGKYVSMININKERHRFGTHATPHEAVGARNNYIIKNGLWEYPVQGVPDYMIN